MKERGTIETMLLINGSMLHHQFPTGGSKITHNIIFPQISPEPAPSSPDPGPSLPSSPPASERLSVTGECRISLLRRSISSETVALISMHWQERGI